MQYTLNPNPVSRHGDAKKELEELAAICCRPLQAKDGIEPTNLYARNKDVNDVNERKLAALPGDLVSHRATLKP